MNVAAELPEPDKPLLNATEGISMNVKRLCLVGIIIVGVGAGLPKWNLIRGEPVSKRIRDYTLSYYRAPEHAVPPLNTFDPYDCFLKDADGNLVMSLARTNLFSTYSGAEFRGFYLKTKTGNNTLVYQPTPARRQQVKTNCHGLTFLAGEYWMMDDQIEKVLRDDGWSKIDISEVKPGDVAIYRELQGKIVHSAKVVGQDARGRVLVNSKNGYEDEVPQIWAFKPVAD
jgi:hypothetical protein